MIGILSLNRVLLAYLIGLVSLTCGCAVFGTDHSWPTPILTAPFVVASTEKGLSPELIQCLPLQQAENAYADAIRRLQADDARCVDDFYLAAMLAYQQIETQLQSSNCYQGRASEIYRSSLDALVVEGKRFNRLDPSTGLRVNLNGESIQVPIILNNFPSRVDNLDDILHVGDYQCQRLNHHYCQQGLGTAVIGIRNRVQGEQFQRKNQWFASTMLLRPIEFSATNELTNCDTRYVLELSYSLKASTIDIAGVEVPLHKDTSAPIAWVINTTKQNYLQSFLQPGSIRPEEEGLFMVAPYEAGKIPIVFVHGLLSDPLTWVNTLNELMARQDLIDHYQIWGFEYATGDPFIRNAALLKEQLAQIRGYTDPSQADPALNKTLLVGHSMGGLISKMQVVQTDDKLWRSISKIPFESTRMSPANRQLLSSSLFYEPSPMASRVVFIGTPHHGSAVASRAIGRLGSILVSPSDEITALRKQLIDANPGAFSQEFQRRIPTSIDLLKPDSEMLNAVRRMNVAENVELHSIIGRGRWQIGSGDSDGVVPVTSARHPYASSEKYVEAPHSGLTHDPAMIDELIAIMRLHLRGSK